MEAHIIVQERRDLSVEEPTGSEVVKRIRKLRWLGLDEEVEQLKVVLRGVDPGDTVLADPGDTD